DNMFGGDGRFRTRVEGRDFTPTEQRIIQGLLNVVFNEYSRSWKPVYDINFEYIRSEMNSQFANIATPSEIVISTSFTLEFGGTAADMHICFPYSMVEPIRDLLYSSMQSDQLGQILKMKTGDIIPLHIPEVIVAHVDDIPLMECRYGQQGGQYALKIERFITPESEEIAQGEHYG
ncbi:MAG: FliM/FliN family flagellar motor switch protein, partial [Deltaproteobacteria bacterium]|nr:FliM/FliN family flagellar motor switch protein [Deltaproteobacteria bacterium]